MKRRRTGPLALLALGALLLIGSPVASAPRSGRLPEQEAVHRFMAGKLRAARKALAAGRLDHATEMLKAIQTLYPEESLGKKVRAALETCEQRLLRQDAISGQTTSGQAVYTSGREVDITFRMKNISDVALRIPTRRTVTERAFFLPDEETQNNQIDIRYAVFEYHLAGGQRYEERTQYMTFDKPIQLNPTEAWQDTFHFKTARRGADSGVVTRIRVIASLQPLTFYRDNKLEYRSKFMFDPVTVTVMPEEVEQHIDLAQPLASLTRGLKENKPATIFYAAALILAKDKPHATALLIKNLKADEDSAQQQAVMSALSLLTGRYHDNNPTLWLTWWAKEQARINTNQKDRQP